MNNSPASIMNIIAELSYTCKQCEERLGVVQVIEAISPVLIPYAIAIKPNFCAFCGFQFSKASKKQLITSISSEIIFDINKTYGTEEVIKMLGQNSRYWLRDARKDNILKYKKIGIKITYLGKDLDKWYRGFKNDSR